MKPIYYSEKYVLDADIKGCFDNIEHNWVLNNLPMPVGYKHLLYECLKTRIVAHDGEGRFKVVTEWEDNNKGVPQGGIISPLIMN